MLVGYLENLASDRRIITTSSLRMLHFLDYLSGKKSELKVYVNE